MEDGVVDFDIAILAKEKGFDIDCLYKHLNEDQIFKCIGTPWECQYDPPKENFINAPTQSLLQKWLREKHNIDIVIYPVELKTETRNVFQKIQDKEYSYYISIGGIQQYFVYKCHSSYEEALEQGLLEGLKSIK